MPSKCSLCDADASTQCGKCRAAWYCSREHQIEDWKSHKLACFPVLIKSDHKMGRYLISSRDIEAGEIIIKESPLLTSPGQFTQPICLVCTKRVDGSYNCPKCNWPLCDSNCQNSEDHIPECTLSKTEGGIRVKNFDIQHPLYEFIAPLRCLWIRDNNSDKWNAVLKMESHSVERKENGKEEKSDHMKTYLNLDNYTSSEVAHAFGVIEVNSFEIPMSNKIALYEKVSLLSHSCYPNTYRSFNIKEEVVVKASVNIARNEIITISYIDTVYGSLERQYLLKTSKYFQCDCVRCNDPTEMGTNISSLPCRNCKLGIVNPPRSNENDWICHICGEIENQAYIVDTLTSFSESVPKMTEDINNCKMFLADSKKYLSDNHYLRIGVKIRLLILYGSEEFDKGKQVSEDSINRKINICNELLQFADKIMPGNNMFRGLILSELQNALVWRYQSYAMNNKGKRQRLETLMELQKILPTILTTYLEDSIVSDERDIVETTKKSVTLVENELLQLG